MRPTTNDMASYSTSVFSQEHMASFSAAVFSNADLAKTQCFKSENTDETSTTEESSGAMRKRKATSAVSLVSLDRSIEEEATFTVATRDAKEPSCLSGCKNSTGLMLLSFPMKLHWMLYECELCHETKRKSMAKTKEKKKPKLDDACSQHNNHNDLMIIGWLPGGTAFKIFDQDRFVEEVMPTYFSGTFEDFQKDLALWGFTNVPSVGGPPTRRLHFCSHPNFVRDQPNRCRAMRFGGILNKTQALERKIAHS